MGRKKKIPTEKDKCGCEHDGREWINMCTPHKTEYEEHHKQAQIDYRRTEDERMNDKLLRDPKSK